PLSSQLGIGFGEVAGSLAAMSRLGLNAAESSTALKGIMVGILKPAMGAQKAMKEMGWSFEAIRTQLKEEGLLPMLLRLREMFGENEAALARVFPRAEGLVGVLNLIGKNADTAQQIIGSVATATGEDLNKAFDAASKTAKFKLNVALSSMRAILTSLGAEVLPVLLPLLSQITGVLRGAVDVFQTLDPSSRRFVIIMAGIAAAAGPVAIGIGVMITGLSSLAATLGMAASSMGLLVLGIGAIVAAVALWIVKWDEIKEGTVVIVQWMKEKVVEAFDLMVLAVKVSIDEFVTLIEPIRNFTRNVVDSMKWMADMVVGRSIIPEMVSGIERVMLTLDEGMVKPVSRATDMVAMKMKFVAEQTAGSLGSLTAELAKSKISWADYVQSVIIEIMKLIAKIMILKTVKTAAGVAFGMGFIGALQYGGRARPGEPYMIGERGPELWTPDTAGTVQPIPAMAGAGMFAPSVTVHQTNTFGGGATEDISRVLVQIKDAT
ncbi:unnamed protein product, partial [marine sediment metagenome]